MEEFITYLDSAVTEITKEQKLKFFAMIERVKNGDNFTVKECIEFCKLIIEYSGIHIDKNNPSFKIEKLNKGVRGYYDRSLNEIVIAEFLLKKLGRDKSFFNAIIINTIHEYTHFLQHELVEQIEKDPESVPENIRDFVVGLQKDFSKSPFDELIYKNKFFDIDKFLNRNSPNDEENVEEKIKNSFLARSKIELLRWAADEKADGRPISNAVLNEMIRLEKNTIERYALDEELPNDALKFYKDIVENYKEYLLRHLYLFKNKYSQDINDNIEYRDDILYSRYCSDVVERDARETSFNIVEKLYDKLLNDPDLSENIKQWIENVQIKELEKDIDGEHDLRMYYFDYFKNYIKSLKERIFSIDSNKLNRKDPDVRFYDYACKMLINYSSPKDVCELINFAVINDIWILLKTIELHYENNNLITSSEKSELFELLKNNKANYTPKAMAKILEIFSLGMFDKDDQLEIVNSILEGGKVTYFIDLLEKIVVYDISDLGMENLDKKIKELNYKLKRKEELTPKELVMILELREADDKVSQLGEIQNFNNSLLEVFENLNIGAMDKKSRNRQIATYLEIIYRGECEIYDRDYAEEKLNSRLQKAKQELDKLEMFKEALNFGDEKQIKELSYSILNSNSPFMKVIYKQNLIKLMLETENADVVYEISKMYLSREQRIKLIDELINGEKRDLAKEYITRVIFNDDNYKKDIKAFHSYCFSKCQEYAKEITKLYQKSQFTPEEIEKFKKIQNFVDLINEKFFIVKESYFRYDLIHVRNELNESLSHIGENIANYLSSIGDKMYE